MYMKKIMIENQKKRQNMEFKQISQKSPSKRSFIDEIHSLLKPTDARESADIIYVICDAYRQFGGYRHSYWCQKVGHAENI